MPNIVLTSTVSSYFETTEILYSANTFSIESPVLIRTFHSIISSQMRTQLSSLTFSWDLKKVSLGQSFKFQTLTVWSSSSTKPLFPSLRYLRLALDPFPRVTESIFAPPGFPNPPRVDKRMMRRRLYEEFYPGFEALLDMVAPVAAEVTLTLSDWDLYECIDLDLVNKQGREKTSLQRSEYGGLKCWKERVSRNGTTT